jgi:hypothetical protein
MSKADALRAMREARFAGTPSVVRTPTATAASETQVPAAKSPATRTRAVKTAKPAASTEQTALVEPTGNCGHRSIGNKVCQRPAGHSEKSHRY